MMTSGSAQARTLVEMKDPSCVDLPVDGRVPLTDRDGFERHKMSPVAGLGYYGGICHDLLSCEAAVMLLLGVLLWSSAL